MNQQLSVPDRQAVTRLLQELGAGNKDAFGQLMPVVYDQLRKLASRCLVSERPDHTLRATALVHEAYLRLVDSEVAWRDRAHFYALAARIMRHILVDHAKARKRQKRGCGVEHVLLDEAIVVAPETSSGLLELDEALERLSSNDPRKGQIVELLFFGGLTYAEIAAVLNISPASVHRELRLAKAWLYRELDQQANVHRASHA
jgi:RNA polymerase sigma factor (TIGR02999 family)